MSHNRSSRLPQSSEGEQGCLSASLVAVQPFDFGNNECAFLGIFIPICVTGVNTAFLNPHETLMGRSAYRTLSLPCPLPQPLSRRTRRRAEDRLVTEKWERALWTPSLAPRKGGAPGRVERFLPAKLPAPQGEQLPISG